MPAQLGQPEEFNTVVAETGDFQRTKCLRRLHRIDPNSPLPESRRDTTTLCSNNLPNLA
jgi:hypothetical protein